MTRSEPIEQHCLYHIIGDVRTYPFERGEFTHIIHCAESGTQATENILKSGAKILMISSGAAYYPGTIYSDEKIESEKLCKKNGAIICRLFSFMGPYFPMNSKFAAGTFIRDALKSGVIFISGDEKYVRSYMHTEDMSEWIWKLLDYGEPGQTYDVGSREKTTIFRLAKEIAKQIEEKTGKSIAISMKRGDVQALAPKNYYPFMPEITNEFGLKVRYNLKQTISKTINWALENNI